MKYAMTTFRRRCLRLTTAMAMATVGCSACTDGTTPAPRTFETADDAARGSFDRLLLGPGIGAGRTSVDRVTLAAGADAFAEPRVLAGTTTVFVLEGSVHVSASELEDVLGANEVATFAAGLEHQFTATDDGPATIIWHVFNPRESRSVDESQ